MYAFMPPPRMLELIKGFVNRVIADPRDIVKSNAEILVIRHSSGERSVVNSYPAASKTLRGSGGDVLWLEEAAFMPEALFFEVVLPLLEVEKTSMLAISTPSPDGSLNFYTSMMATKNANGEPMFKCLTIAMACEECLKQGLASSCTHMESFRPPWKSASKFSMVKAIYSQNKGMCVCVLKHSPKSHCLLTQTIISGLRARAQVCWRERAWV